MLPSSDNDFPMKEQKEKAMYPCSVNYSEAEYASLKANEKFLLFWFAHLTNENTQSYKRKAKEFLGQYSAMLGVSKRVVRSYMHTLKKLFCNRSSKGNMLHYIFA